MELVNSYDGCQKETRINCMVSLGEHIWIGTTDSIQIRHHANGDLLHEITNAPAFHFAVVNDQLWVGNHVGQVSAYDLETRECQSLDLGAPVLTMIQVGSFVWGACADKVIRIWEIEVREGYFHHSDYQSSPKRQSKNCENEIPMEQGRLNSFSVINSTVWGSFDNACVIVWDADVSSICLLCTKLTLEKSQEVLATLTKRHSAKVFGAVLVDHSVWTYAWDGEIHLYDPVVSPPY